MLNLCFESCLVSVFDLFYLWHTIHLIELCSNVYQNVNLVLSILPFFGGVDAFIGLIWHNFWYLFFEILWQKSRHWDVAIFLHSSNFCAMVLQCVYCILLFLCVHLLPHFYDNLVKRCHSLILYKDTKRLYKVMSRDYYSNIQNWYIIWLFFFGKFIFFSNPVPPFVRV